MRVSNESVREWANCKGFSEIKAMAQELLERRLLESEFKPVSARYASGEEPRVGDVVQKMGNVLVNGGMFILFNPPDLYAPDYRLVQRAPNKVTFQQAATTASILRDRQMGQNFEKDINAVRDALRQARVDVEED